MTIQLDPRIREDLIAVHKELLSRGELYPQKALDGFYDTFRQRFGPERLSQLDGEELLEVMHAHGNKESLVYWLEFKNDEELPAISGGIGGGSALKFGIYRSNETGNWMTGSPRSQKILNVSEAITVARRNRDQFIAGCRVLDSISDDAMESDYQALQKKLSEIAPNVYDMGWGHKYFSMMFPDKLDTYHNYHHQRSNLIKLLQMPPKDGGRYSAAWIFLQIAKQLGMSLNHLIWTLYERNGRIIKYWRIGTRIAEVLRWDEMRLGNYVAVGWDKIEDLSHLVHDQKSKNRLKEMMAECYPAAPQHVGNQTAQLFNFVTTIQEGDFLLVSDGERVHGIARAVGGYYYVPNSEYPHRRNLELLSVDVWKMPIREGLQTTCREIKKNAENLIEAERKILDTSKKLPQPAPLSGIAGRIQKILDRKRQVILYGPPGTGKTFWAQVVAKELTALDNFNKPLSALTEAESKTLENIGSNDIGYINICCFHPEYGYEDFIEGYRPHLVGGTPHFELRDGLFKQICKRASVESTKRFYLIIDEINRGDIPRIFGELIMVLEANKRGNRITLPVSSESFHVPSNVYVIGTMNTADRSIALLDTALRRRFGFIELMPDIGVLEDLVLEGIPIRQWLKALNNRICQHIGRDARNLQIGHAYLMPDGKTVASFNKFADIVREDVIPLLEEYCYEDFSILANLLGTSLVDETAMRIRDKLFEPAARDKLVSALLAPCPEIAASSLAVDSEAEEPDTDEDDNDETENGQDES